MHRPHNAALAAALLAATAGALPLHTQAGTALSLSAADQRILRPTAQYAQSCLRELGPLSVQAAFVIRTGHRSSTMRNAAEQAILTCAAAEQVGVQLVRQRYPLRARKGRLRLVLSRFEALLGGGRQAGVGCLAMANDITDYEPGDAGASARMAADATSAEQGLIRARDAAEALRLDIPNL